MCLQKGGVIDDLSEEELFDGIDKAIKNISSHSDLILNGCNYTDKQLRDDFFSIGCLFESYFRQECEFLKNGFDLYTEKKPKKNKRKNAQHFTPVYISEYICKQTIIPLIRKKVGTKYSPDEKKEDVSKYLKTLKEVEDLKICDPAMGGGIFLICAHDLVTEEMVRIDKRLTYSEASKRAVKTIYGVDIDPNAVKAAKLMINLNLMKWNMKDKLKEYVSTAV